jgi:HK97 gp10 family phage protein
MNTPQISIQVKGATELAKKFSVMPTKMKLAAHNAVNKIAFSMEKETKPLVPVDTGHLRRMTRAIKTSKPMSAEFGSYTEYSWYQHEGRFKHKIGERKFVEKGVNKVKPNIESIFNKEIRKVIK